jgi:hypothetical protein
VYRIAGDQPRPRPCGVPSGWTARGGGIKPTHASSEVGDSRCEDQDSCGSILRLAGADIHRPNSAMACRSGTSGRDRVHWCHAVEPAALPGQVEHVAMRTPSRSFSTHGSLDLGRAPHAVIRLTLFGSSTRQQPMRRDGTILVVCIAKECTIQLGLLFWRRTRSSVRKTGQR